MEDWQFSEGQEYHSTDMGSGYPSDPICKQWMEQNQSCPIFGYPDVVRFSWGPAKKALQAKAIPVAFCADEEIEEEDEELAASMKIGLKRQRDHMRAFLGKTHPAAKKRMPYFEQRHIVAVTDF